MVRFSDMLGGNGDPDPGPEPVAAPPPAPALDEGDEPGPDDPAPAQSPEDVLDRLTQYASSARATDPPVPEATAPEPAGPADDAEEPLTTVGDDLLPHPKGEKGKRRRK